MVSYSLLNDVFLILQNYLLDLQRPYSHSGHFPLGGMPNCGTAVFRMESHINTGNLTHRYYFTMMDQQVKRLRMVKFQRDIGSIFQGKTAFSMIC